MLNNAKPINASNVKQFNSTPPVPRFGESADSYANRKKDWENNNKKEKMINLVINSRNSKNLSQEKKREIDEDVQSNYSMDTTFSEKNHVHESKKKKDDVKSNYSMDTTFSEKNHVHVSKNEKDDVKSNYSMETGISEKKQDRDNRSTRSRSKSVYRFGKKVEKRSPSEASRRTIDDVLDDMDERSDIMSVQYFTTDHNFDEKRLDEGKEFFDNYQQYNNSNNQKFKQDGLKIYKWNSVFANNTSDFDVFCVPGLDVAGRGMVFSFTKFKKKYNTTKNMIILDNIYQNNELLKKTFYTLDFGKLQHLLTLSKQLTPEHTYEIERMLQYDVNFVKQAIINRIEFYRTFNLDAQSRNQLDLTMMIELHSVDELFTVCTEVFDYGLLLILPALIDIGVRVDLFLTAAYKSDWIRSVLGTNLMFEGLIAIKLSYCHGILQISNEKGAVIGLTFIDFMESVKMNKELTAFVFENGQLSQGQIDEIQGLKDVFINDV